MAVLTGRNLKGDLDETRKAIENAEYRARFDQKKTDVVGAKNNREYAQALHREADQLYRSSDYESALVLYHRAANLYPKDSSHSVAARRTAATISSCHNPSKALRKALPTTGTGERLTLALCPETAAIMANEKLKKSPDPSSINEVLRYFDHHKTYWKTLPTPRISNSQLSKSKLMLKQLNNLAETSLKNLQSTFSSGKMSASLKIAQELLMLSGGFRDPTRYQIAAYHYLSLIHVALGRHDRAVCNVSRLVRLSKSTEDLVLICRALVTLGKVHLSFGHLEAAAKAWEHLSKDLKKPIPVAWIRHEIGRCYLETGKFRRALEMGGRCVEAAARGNSKKWMLNGRLLLGQTLAKLGRFVEALEELQMAAKITEEEGDTPMLSYIQDLIEQVARALRKIPQEDGAWGSIGGGISRAERIEENSSLFISREEAVITTVFSQRRVITECQEESSIEDDEVTIHSEKTAQTYRESTICSDLDEREEEQDVPAGSSTFRVDGSAENKKKVASPSSSSSSSLSTSSDEKSENVEDLGGSTNRTETDARDGGLKGESSSKASLRSDNTTATYVIQKEENKRAIDIDDKGAIAERFKIAIDDNEGNHRITEALKMVNCNDREQRQDMINAVRVIEELGKKDEVELLEMLRDMLLTEDRDYLGNSGDGFKTSRSGDDRQSGITTNRSTVSLPPTPRKFNADEDFRKCHMPLPSN